MSDAAGGMSVQVTVGDPPGTGAMTDATTPPGSANNFPTYTWNQATTAMFGGCGDGSVVDSNNHHLPATWTYADPRTMETAHHAFDQIAGMLQTYAQSVLDSADAITTDSWQGPAADAFTQVIKAFAKYLTDMAGPVKEFVNQPENLHTLARRLDLAGQAAGIIWPASEYFINLESEGHDRNTPVTLSGAFSFNGKMGDAGWTMLSQLDTAYKAVLE
jgi:hypothetical protein